MSEENSADFDHGRRAGIFDRCNSRQMMNLSHLPSDDEFRVGYLDGWNSCDPQIETDDYQRGLNLVAELCGAVVVPWLDENMPTHISQEFRRGMIENWVKFLEGAVKNV